jgi:hypothetical protein
MRAGAKGPNSEAQKWLSSIGLAHYAQAFEASGYDDWLQLSQLEDSDLDAIEQAGRLQMLPGHRKKILIASRLLAEVGQNRQSRAEARLAVPWPSSSDGWFPRFALPPPLDPPPARHSFRPLWRSNPHPQPHPPCPAGVRRASTQRPLEGS